MSRPEQLVDRGDALEHFCDSIFPKRDHTTLNGGFLQGSGVHIFDDEGFDDIIDNHEFMDHGPAGITAIGTTRASHRPIEHRAFWRYFHAHLTQLELGRSVFFSTLGADTADQSLGNHSEQG